jgi:RP/EB family microtubule-associated protein
MFILLSVRAMLIKKLVYLFFLQIVNAIHKVLYAAEDDPSMVAEAQAMISQQQQSEQPMLSPILEASEERPAKQEAHKRKSISDLELEEFGMASSSRQRLSDISDVQLCGSPLTSFT